MRFDFENTSGKALIIGLVLTIIAIATFGITLGMSATNGGIMLGCPLMNGFSSLCQMDILGHIAQWQTLFTSIIPSSALALIVLLLLTVLSFVRFKLEEEETIRQQLQYLLQKDPTARLFNYLVLLFSSGVLHPKIY